MIELLVVISIIAILAGLLLPSLNAARATAQSIACVNNQKTLSSVLTFYSDDNNSFLLPVRDTTRGVSAYWPIYLTTIKYSIFNTTALWSVQKRQVWHCPSEPSYDPKKLQGGGSNGTAEYCNYGLNSHTNGFQPVEWKRYQWMKSPSLRAWIADTAWYTTYDKGIRNLGGGTYFGRSDSHISKAQILARRHKDNVNFIFHDGHAEKINLFRIPTGTQCIQDGTFKEQGNSSNQVAYPY